MIVPESHLPRLSSNKKVNPYKACIYELCRDFLDGVGYDLGTKYNFYLNNLLKAFPNSCSKML